MDDTFEITIDGGEPIVLAATSREEAEGEANHYRHSLYPGSNIRLYQVHRTLIDEGQAVDVR